MMQTYEHYKESGIDWIGQIPKHWGIKRLKYLFNEINERSIDGSEDLLSVSQYTGVTKKSEKIDDGDLLTNASTLKGYKKVRKHKLVSNIMLAWNGSLAFSEYNGITSPAYCIYELKHDDVYKYFHYLFKTDLYKSEFKRNSSGVIESRLRLYTDDFFSIWSVLPPIHEQEAIANFLDDKTVKIDALVQTKEQQIEKLKELRQAKIHEAVIKGLDANAPTKDSGVEWIGEIPENWEVKKVKEIFKLIIEPAPIGNEYELLSVYTNIGVKPRKELEEKGNKASSTDGYWIVRKGDIIVNKLLAWMGAIGISNYNGVTSPAYDILRNKVPIVGLYYHNLFRMKSTSTELKRHSRGIMEMRLRLYFEKFGQILVPFPPLEEQEAIVAYLDEVTGKIDQAISQKQ